MGRKVPFWCFAKQSLPSCSKFKHKILRKIIRKPQKRQPSFRFVTQKMKSILKNGSSPTKYKDVPIACVPKKVHFGETKSYYNLRNPNRTSYMLALRKRHAKRNVAQLAINKSQRRVERAACESNGLNCDASGNSYPYMTNMRTFLNSARNAVLMNGYTAARKVIFAAKKIVIKPRSGKRQRMRRRAATI